MCVFGCLVRVPLCLVGWPIWMLAMLPLSSVMNKIAFMLRVVWKRGPKVPDPPGSPKFPLGTWLRCGFVETLAVAFYLSAVPLRWCSGTCPKCKVPDKLKFPDEVPVCIVPGYLGNAMSLCWLRRKIQDRLNVHVFCLKPCGYFVSIEELVADFTRQVAEILRDHDVERVDLVGHSAGGIIARLMLEHSAVTETAEPGPAVLAHRIRNVVCIGAPHTGTFWGIKLFGLPVSQLGPTSQLLADLNGHVPPADVAIASIASFHDQMVVPWNRAVCPVGENHVLVSGLGHMSMLLSGEVVALVARLLTHRE